MSSRVAAMAEACGGARKKVRGRREGVSRWICIQRWGRRVWRGGVDAVRFGSDGGEERERSGGVGWMGRKWAARGRERDGPERFRPKGFRRFLK